jgi:hypothetical protein
LPAVAAELAADQIIRLNAGRAFIDGRDARIAQVLRDPGFLDESHAAMDLDPSEAISIEFSVHQPLTTGIIRSANA